MSTCAASVEYGTTTPRSIHRQFLCTHELRRARLHPSLASRCSKFSRGLLWGVGRRRHLLGLVLLVLLAAVRLCSSCSCARGGSAVLVLLDSCRVCPLFNTPLPPRVSCSFAHRLSVASFGTDRCWQVSRMKLYLQSCRSVSRSSCCWSAASARSPDERKFSLQARPFPVSFTTSSCVLDAQLSFASVPALVLRETSCGNHRVSNPCRSTTSRRGALSAPPLQLHVAGRSRGCLVVQRSGLIRPFRLGCPGVRLAEDWSRPALRVQLCVAGVIELRSVQHAT